MRHAVIGILVCGLVAAEPAVAAPISEAKAKAAAVKILIGDPYGKTPAAVLSHIKGAMLVTSGTTGCGPVRHPQWVLHVVAQGMDQPIDGDLVLNARSGELDCAGLPFLD